MAIRITRNEEGNCITFVGSSNPAYFNACLSAQINADDASRVDIINDIRSENEETTQYEFYAVDIADFADRDGNSFADAQAMVDYVNANANVVGVSSVGTNLNGLSVNFRLDDTSTSIIMDNGSSFGVNTVKAVADTDGTIHIHSIGAGTPEGSDEPNVHKHFEGLEVGNVSVNGSTVSGGIQDIVNTLNELFTVGAFESVVISDPFSTMIADVAGVAAGYTLVGSNAVDPIGSDIFTNSTTGNLAGLKSTEYIDQAGEYFTFDIRGEGQIGFGLVHTQASYDAGHYSGNVNYANPTTFAVSNSAHYGFQFSHWFHPTPNGSWTNYGANTGVVYGSGWYNWESQNEWLAGENVKVKVGIDENGFIAISTLQDDDTTWVLHARSSYPVPEGSSFHLGIKSASPAARVSSAPKAHLLEEAAPVMNFRYIESPDGNFEYPLFATAEEANYYDGVNGGSSTSHTHTYDDDPTNTTWYMPDTNSTMVGTVAPTSDSTLGVVATYTEISSVTNADLTPIAFSGDDITQEEGTNVNVQVTPAGASWSTSVTISPSGSGLVYDNYSVIQGTLTDVGSTTAYTVTVTRANAYGSSVGTFTITATDVAPATTMTTPWTKALDFNSYSQYARMARGGAYFTPVAMGGAQHEIALPTTAGYTSSDGNEKPWATAVVFRPTGYYPNGEQIIWNQDSRTDSIYLKLTTNNLLYFGWGNINGTKNEVQIASIAGGQWTGLYIAHNGARFSAANATEANLRKAFDIRKYDFANGTVGSNLADRAGYWTSTGAAMQQAFGGYFDIGGKGTSYNLHGKVASMVVTTLTRQGTAMPSDAEIVAMISDPNSWVTNYRVGNDYRLPNNDQNKTNFQTTSQDAMVVNQIWLMGDGTSDSYSNGIRNNFIPTDAAFTKLTLNSMVSNDIETVNISGLT